MKTESSTVQKLYITDVQALDPITLIYENFGSNRGQIIVKCYDKVWSAFWGGMGCDDVLDFVRKTGNEYLVDRLAPYGTKKKDLDYLDRIVTALKQGIASFQGKEAQ